MDEGPHDNGGSGSHADRLSGCCHQAYRFDESLRAQGREARSPDALPFAWIGPASADAGRARSLSHGKQRLRAVGTRISRFSVDLSGD
jgi:hypothetical protein